MTPEERLAAKLIVSKGLKPPVPIKELLSEFADIEYGRLPAGSDAVLLRKQSKKNYPLVIIDPTKPEKRMRFTLAHELGHILIPWHIGTISCHTSSTIAFGADLYQSTETEANRFASELLMPSAWMKAVVDNHKDIGTIFQEVQQAEVSGTSASISLCKVLPAGFVFVAVGEKEKIIATAKSVGTAAPLMIRGDDFKTAFYDRTGAKRVKCASKGTTIYWWDFTAGIELSNSDDVRSSHELLSAILALTSPNAEDRKKIELRINGIIGAANGRHRPSTSGQLDSVLRQRFVDRDSEIMACVSHPDFALFILRRAEEIMARNNAK